ncbi:hypothetical protein TW65_86980 [Stemphylium lycopersici]|nr:hypothetical protein TW65_86980 [Stemphylium lycopersici]
MSSYDSNKSGHLAPQYQQQPPYPTTPAPPSQSQNYFPPIPEQQQQPVYSSSPNQPTSPYATMPEPNIGRRRTSSSSSYNPQLQPQPPTQSMPMPMPIRQPDPHQYQHPAASYPPPVSYAQQAPVYARSTSQQSHYSQHGRHAYADGEDKYEGRHHHHGHQHGGLDLETEREYKRRYAKEKEFERRPTLGGSLLSMVDKVGKAFGSERH